AKKAAQLIRAEAAAMQDTAVDTLAKLQEAARIAREASDESQVAAERHAASIEKRLGALAATVNAKKAAPAPRVAERVGYRAVVVGGKPMVETSTMQSAASAAVVRGGQRQRMETRAEAHEPRRVFRGFGGWGNFMPQTTRMEEPKHVEPAPAANDLVDFGT